MLLPEYFEFQSRTKVVFGKGILKEVARHVQELNAKNVLLVIDPFLHEQGYSEKINHYLTEQNIELKAVFSDIPIDSDIEKCNQGRELYLEKGCDIIIAFGGGSTIDTAKGINILVSEGGDLLEDHQGTYLLKQPLKSMIAIPTTAGSGSETTFAAVIKDLKENLKISFISPYIAPDIAILDPELTINLPPQLTASTGMDALSHAIESIHSKQNEPITDALALHAIKLIADNLYEATHNGKNIEARGNMLIAANLAGLAFSNALVGLVHAMAHALGSKCSVPHGIANSIMLPYGMEFNISHCPRYRLVAEALGINVKRKSDEAAAIEAIKKIRKLSKKCGLPQKLSKVGVKEEDLDEVATTALADGALYNNPREVEKEEEIKEILKKAL